MNRYRSRAKGRKLTIKEYLAPINPDGFQNIAEWRPSEEDGSIIIGTWAEDGCGYKIKCPTQLRNCIMAMQNLLPYFLELHDNAKVDEDKRYQFGAVVYDDINELRTWSSCDLNVG